MRKTSSITRQSCEAFWKGRKYSKNNTSVEIDHEGNIYFYLNSHLLAHRSETTLQIDDNGWRSIAARDRINGILNKIKLRVYGNCKEWYIEGRPKKQAERWEGRLRIDLTTVR